MLWAALALLFWWGMGVPGAWGEPAAAWVKTRDGSLVIAREAKGPDIFSRDHLPLILSRGVNLWVLPAPRGLFPQGTGRFSRAFSPGFGGSAPALDPLICKYAVKYGVDPALVRAVIFHESGFDPLAVSPKGAQGLMQLMPGTAALMGVSNPFDPEQNIAGGVGYLRYCLDRFGQDVPLALAAYNAGPERVARSQGIPAIAETQNFVRNVLASYGKVSSPALSSAAAARPLTPPSSLPSKMPRVSSSKAPETGRPGPKIIEVRHPRQPPVTLVRTRKVGESGPQPKAP